MSFARMALVAIVVLACTISGLLLTTLPTGDTPEWYSGEFKLSSSFKDEIQVKDWSDFGNAQPPRGYVSEKIHKQSSFHSLAEYPDSTTVSWVVVGDSDVQSQMIDLRGVVPIRTKGVTKFHFDTDGVWHVMFAAGEE